MKKETAYHGIASILFLALKEGEVTAEELREDVSFILHEVCDTYSSKRTTEGVRPRENK